MSRAAFLAIALAACRTAEPAQTPVAAPARPLPPVPASTMPAPTVAYSDDGELTWDGLPAVAADGSLVVLAHRDNDGGRGNANLTLVAIGRTDERVGSLVVITTEDPERLSAKAIQERFTVANDWLAKLHAQKKLQRLAPTTADHEDCQCADVDGTRVTWRPSKLGLAGPDLHVERPTPPTWLAPSRPMYRGSPERCENPARLQTVALDRARRIALLTISYEGNDTCWEPSDQEHVVSW